MISLPAACKTSSDSDVTEAPCALETSGESPREFREAFEKQFRPLPAPRSAKDCIVVSPLDTPVGMVLLGATAKAVCLLEFTCPERLDSALNSLKRWFKQPVYRGTNEHLDQLQTELEAYFSGKLKIFSVPLEFPGTPFQERVWRQLLEIPYGETCSYEALAQASGSSGAVRAVGSANGQNRIAIVIPCHRVINKSGALGGYGGGLPRKRFLLDLEARVSGRRGEFTF